MHRFFLPPEACGGSVVSLDERDSHHASRVLRVEPGEGVEVLDGFGRVLAGRVVGVERREVRVEVTGVRRVPAPPRVTLAVAVLKGRAMDFLVQKATELGATEIRPVLAERGVVRIGVGEAEDKVEGWRVTAMEACKQCGNPWLPGIHPPQELKGVLAARGEGILLVGALWGTPRLPGQALGEWAGGSGPCAGVTLVIGPEGDLSPAEVGELEAAGAVPITLGPLVLRAETAAIAALAVVQHALRMAGAGVGVGVGAGN